MGNCDRNSANAGDKEPWDGQRATPLPCGAFPRHLKRHPLRYPHEKLGPVCRVPVIIDSDGGYWCGVVVANGIRSFRLLLGRGHCAAASLSVMGRQLTKETIRPDSHSSDLLLFIGGAVETDHFCPLPSSKSVLSFLFTVRVSSDNTQITYISGHSLGNTSSRLFRLPLSHPSVCPRRQLPYPTFRGREVKK